MEIEKPSWKLSNFNFLRATLTPEANFIPPIIPEAFQSTHLHQSCDSAGHTDGETSLYALALELDTLLYSEHGEYVLDEETIVLESISASVEDVTYDMESLDALAFELDLLFDILVFEADMSCELENENSINFKSDFKCDAPSESQSSLPSITNAPNIETLSTLGTEHKPRPPSSPNIVILDTMRPSKFTKVLQMSSQVDRKF